MLKHGTAYVPTMLTVKLAVEMPKFGVTEEYYKLASASLNRAYTAHVPILFGTDLPIVPIAREWEEFLALQDGGLTSTDALKAATVNAAAALGMTATLGSIETGKSADVIALAHDPREDLHEMGKVIFVMKEGKTARNDMRDGG